MNTRNIELLSDAPHELTDLLALLNAQPQFETTIIDIRGTSPVRNSTKCDVTLYCVLSDERHAQLSDFVLQNAPQTPIIVLLNHPTVDQAVDLMRVGSIGVADWRDSQRILDLIRVTLNAVPNALPELFYRDLVDQQTELICRYDVELRLLFVNRAYCEWQGLPAEELIGTRIIDRISAEDRERVTAQLRSLTADNPVVVSIHAAILRDGTHRAIEWTNQAICDALGQVIEYQGVGRDVTEREQQITNLATYRAHLDSVLDTMQDALMSVALPERRVIFVSRAFEEVFGYSHERFMKDRNFFRQVVHPDDLDLTLNAMQTCLREGFVELDHRIVWPDGQVRWIHRRAWTNYNESGQPIRINDSAQDITARKMAEDALRSSDAHLRGLIDSQTNYLIRTDINGHYTYWNPKFEREFGWLHEPSGMLGSVSLGSIMPYHHQRTLEVVEKCFGTPGVPFQVELDKPRRDGTVCTTLWEFICLTDPNGAPTAFQCVGIDISAQKQALATVQRQANLLQHVSDAIIATDRDLRITAWNKAATDIYGWTEAEAIGQQIDELLKTEWTAESQSLAQSSIQLTGRWRGEIRQTDKAGNQHYVVASVDLFYDEQGNPLGGVTVNRDITAQKRREILQEQISQTLEATVERQQLPTILEKLVLAVEQYEPDIRASVLLLDAATSQLHQGAAPSLPDAYNKAIDGIAIGSGVGSCGTAAYEERLVIVEDITNDSLWNDFRELAAEHGLRACWSQPIIGHGGRVLGTFALYYAEPRRPSTDELDLIQLAARIAGLVIEHAQAESALKESEEEYRTLVESSEAVIAVFDTEGDLQFINEIGAAQLGSTPDLLFGKNMRALFPPAVADYQLTSIREVIRTGQGSVHEAPGYVSGEDRWYRTSVQPIRNASGKITTALIHASDITQFKAMEEALRQSEEQFRQFMRYLPGAVFIRDEAGRTIYCNDLYASKFGTTPQHIIGKRSQDYKPESLAVSFMREDEIVLAENRAMEFHHSVPDVDGPSHWLTIRFPIPRAGQSPLLGTMSLDITREKRAEETIKRSEERYRRMFEDVRLPNLILEPQTARILDANSAAVEFYGYSMETLKSMTMLHINIEVPELILKKMAQVLNGESSSWLFKQRMADGSIREVEGFPTGIELNGQQVVYCIFIDVTERNRAKVALESANQQLEQRVQERTRALEQTKDRIEAIFNHSGDGILLLDVNLAIQQTNYAFDQMFKAPHDTYLNKPLLELMAAEDRITIEHYRADILAHHHTHRMEFKCRRLDGTTFDAEISIAPVNRSDNAVRNVVSIVRDVSDRKQAEEKLRLTTGRLQLATQAGEIGIWDYDAENGRMHWDDRMYALYEVDGSTTTPSVELWKSRIHPDDLTKTNADTEAAIRGEKSYDTEFRIIRPDGETRHIRAKANIYRNEKGTVQRIVGVNFDMTRMKQAEANLLLALEKEKELGDLKSRFVSMASHEFRTPLAAILAATETLTLYRDRMDAQQIHARLDKIRQQVAHMKDIMEDVLHLARIQAGRVEFNPALEDLDAFCREINEEFETNPSVQGRIHYHCLEAPVMVEYDKRLMRQIVSNLISNALKYSPVENSVNITLSYTGNEVSLAVCDSGIGIPPEDRQRIFEPFHRGGNVGTISGTGLGLSILNRAVEMHAGTIIVESELGLGTTVTVTIPIKVSKEGIFVRDENHTN